MNNFKKIMLTVVLGAVSLIFLNACSGIIQGASAAGAVLSVSNDRRSSGTILDDKTLHFKVSNFVADDARIKDAHLNFMLYDKALLITGEVANAATRDYIKPTILAKFPELRKIFNETRVASNSGLLSRAKDSAITIQVEFLFQNQEVFHPTHVKVTTENKVIYLMGSVTAREANIAAKTAAKASGADKVVKLFDILKTRPAAEIERDRLRAIAQEKQAEKEKKRAEIESKKAKLLKEIRDLENNKTGTSF